MFFQDRILLQMINFSMKYALTFLFFLILNTLHINVFAQNSILKGDFVSEGTLVVSEDRIFVSVKEFIKHQERKLKKVKQDGMMTYLDLPFEVSNVFIDGDNFRSMLYLFDSDLKLLEMKRLGRNNNSSTIGSVIDSQNNIYIGDKRNQNSAFIWKLDKNGHIQWKQELSSVNNINEMCISQSGELVVLGSMMTLREYKNGDELSLDYLPEYSVFNVDTATGAVTQSNLHPELDYLFIRGFSRPNLNVSKVVYSYRMDSLVYSRLDKDVMTIVSLGDLKGSTIFDVTNSINNHFVLFSSNDPKKAKILYSNFDGEQYTNVSEINHSIQNPVGYKLKKCDKGYGVLIWNKTSYFYAQYDSSLEELNRISEKWNTSSNFAVLDFATHGKKLHVLSITESDGQRELFIDSMTF